MSAEKFKTEKCKVLFYNKNTKELDINFLGYGIRLHDINKDITDVVAVKYRGEIGTPNFHCRL